MRFTPDLATLCPKKYYGSSTEITESKNGLTDINGLPQLFFEGFDQQAYSTVLKQIVLPRLSRFFNKKT